VSSRQGKLRLPEASAAAGRHTQPVGGSLQSRILCERHNNALSPVDARAIAYFEHVTKDQTVLATEGGVWR